MIEIFLLTFTILFLYSYEHHMLIAAVFHKSG